MVLTGDTSPVFASLYAQRRVVVVGAAHGIGSRVAQLLIAAGGEVHTIDIDAGPEGAAAHLNTDIRDLDATALAYRQLPDGIDAAFYCAGVMGIAGPESVMRINFIGFRMLVDELKTRMGTPAAIACTAGRTAFEIGRRHINKRLVELMAIDDYHHADAWCTHRITNAGIYDGSPGRAAFKFSKAALVYYVQHEAFALRARDIRINVTCPALNEDSGYVRSPTESLAPTARPNPIYHDRSIERISTLDQQAMPLLFLNSELASAVSGACLPVDFGETASCLTESIPPHNLGLPGRYGALQPYSED